MGKVIARSIEIHCEDHEKSEVAARITKYLSDKKDWINGNIAVIDERFETVEVVFFDRCENVDELIEVLSF